MCNLLEGRRNFNEKLLSELMTGRSGGFAVTGAGQDRIRLELGRGGGRGIRRDSQGQLGMSATVATVEATVGRADWTVIFLLRSRDIINAVVAMDSMGGEGVKAGRNIILEEEDNSRDRERGGVCVFQAVPEPKKCPARGKSGVERSRFSGGWLVFWR